MSNRYNIETGGNTHQIIQLLEDKLSEHNATTVKKNDGNIFSKIVRDDNKKIIAGIAGWTWANVCEITHIWVDEKARSRGIGKMLLKAAEDEARSKGCRTILVRTFSFQAPYFYDLNGYQIDHVLNNFPEGYSYYILVKGLC
ncbi:MAG: biphenyl 2,3-dioxygenase [Bacteroidetes bacterium]|nr:MAG: biphenyl 2,3-dioxygenase [Bacteroidota bacterium]